MSKQQKSAASRRVSGGNGRKLAAAGGSLGGVRSAPAAQMSSFRSRAGLSDIIGLRIGWEVGFVWVGDGVLGVGGGLFLNTTTTRISGSFINGTTASPMPIPLMASDTVWGAGYVDDVFKHFGRKRYQSIRLIIEPFGNGASTLSTAAIAIGPARGGAFLFSGTTTSGVALQASLNNVLGMKGAIQFPSWTRAEIDMTPYIANVAGGKEFVGNFGYASVTLPTDPDYSSSIVPCSFWLSGSAGNALNGSAVAQVRAECVVDLLDFQGGIAAYLGNALRMNPPAGKDGKQQPVVDATSPAPVGAAASTSHEEKSRGSSDLTVPAAPPALKRQSGFIAVCQDDDVTGCVHVNRQSAPVAAGPKIPQGTPR